jgi:hypothetical protein
MCTLQSSAAVLPVPQSNICYCVQRSCDLLSIDLPNATAASQVLLGAVGQLEDFCAYFRLIVVLVVIGSSILLFWHFLRVLMRRLRFTNGYASSCNGIGSLTCHSTIVTKEMLGTSRT